MNGRCVIEQQIPGGHLVSPGIVFLKPATHLAVVAGKVAYAVRLLYISQPKNTLPGMSHIRA